MKVINAEVESWVKCTDLVESLPDLKRMIRAKFPKQYASVLKDIRTYGADRITIGLNAACKPVNTLLRFD